MRRTSETTVLIHSKERHSEASGGWIEYDYLTEYHYDPKNKEFIQREYSSCDNTRNRRAGWEKRLDSEKIVTLEELPHEVRQKVGAVLGNIH